MRHPPEDVGVAAKLRERAYLGVCGAEIAQEVADGSPVVASGFGMERSCRARRRRGRRNPPADAEAEVAVRDSRKISR